MQVLPCELPCLMGASGLRSPKTTEPTPGAHGSLFCRDNPHPVSFNELLGGVMPSGSHQRRDSPRQLCPVIPDRLLNELLGAIEYWGRHHHLPDARHVLAIIVAH
jgi:hypothetical protein